MSKMNILLLVLLIGVVVSNVLSWIVVGGKVSRTDARAAEARDIAARDSLTREVVKIDIARRELDMKVRYWRAEMDSVRAVLGVVHQRNAALEDWFRRGRK
jgi:uncharacterized ion transporter superfamily protein YfcC